MNVEDPAESKTENESSLDCFCLKRLLCSPNRVSPSIERKNKKQTDGKTENRNIQFSNLISVTPLSENAEMQGKRKSRHSRNQSLPLPMQSPQTSNSPLPLKNTKTPSRGGSVQQSRSSQALVSPIETDMTMRPTTRVMNRNPSAADIARLPHILSPKETHSSQSEFNLTSPQGKDHKNTGFRIGGKVVLPPLPVWRKGAEGDAAKPVLNKTKSLFKRKNENDKKGDNGSGEQVITFSLPSINSVESVELRNQNQVIRKGGMAYDIIIPSSKTSSLPQLNRRPFDQSTRTILGEPKLEPEKKLKRKLERAEKRRLARQEEIRRQSRIRQEQIQQSREEQRDMANDKARHLEEKLEKAAEKRKEQLDNRKAASRKRLERVQRQRRASEGSFDHIETEDMTQEDIWKFLVTKGSEEGEKNIPWWEKKDGISTNTKIPRYKP